MKFLDQAKVYIKSGSGGAGAVTTRPYDGRVPSSEAPR